MIDFKDAFDKGYKIKSTDIDTIFKCKNIDFGHVNWQAVCESFFGNVQLMFHISDNIIDVNTHDDNDNRNYNFISKIIHYSRDLLIVYYVFNNGGVDNHSFNSMYGSDINWKYRELVKYLTIVSLNKFARYYNIEKYYDVCHVILLVMKVQRVLPTAVIKYLIIPFVYQL